MPALCGDMYGDLRRIPLRHREDAEIGDDKCVDADFFTEGEKIRQCGKLCAARQRVAGHVYPCAFGMHEPHALPKLFVCKIRRCGAHPEGLSRKINSVRAVIERSLKALEIACRRKKFRLSVLIHTESLSPYIFSDGTRPKINGRKTCPFRPQR